MKHESVDKFKEIMNFYTDSYKNNYVSTDYNELLYDNKAKKVSEQTNELWTFIFCIYFKV